MITYDTENVGFAWDPTATTGGTIYDTTLDGFSNSGHSGMVAGPDGTTYQLSWDDPNDPQVEALIEYLRTL